MVDLTGLFHESFRGWCELANKNPSSINFIHHSGVKSLGEWKNVGPYKRAYRAFKNQREALHLKNIGLLAHRHRTLIVGI